MKIIKAYYRGMNMLGSCTWEAFIDEAKEFIEEPSVEEFFDTLHSLLRLTGIKVLWLLAWPTVKKHGQRVLLRGCPRSERNCLKFGNDCCCHCERIR